VGVTDVGGADGAGSGGSVAAAYSGIGGMLDLIAPRAGGGSLPLYENRLPPKPYLTVSLRGHPSNRQGVGARLTAVVRGQQFVRELFPANGYRSQAPNQVHFGLGNADTVDTLTIRWPSGKGQVLTGVKGDRHIVR